MRSIACLVSFLLLVAPGAARAGGPPSSVQPETVVVERKVERYGLQIVLADVLWVAAVSAVGEAGGDDGLGSVLGLGFYATGPVVHLAHGNTSGALKSLGARALLPVGGALVGLALAGDEDDDLDALGGMLLGATAGGITALILDWTVFSRKETTTTTSSFALRTRLRPDVKIQRGGLALSLAGSF